MLICNTFPESLVLIRLNHAVKQTLGGNSAPGENPSDTGHTAECAVLLAEGFFPATRYNELPGAFFLLVGKNQLVAAEAVTNSWQRETKSRGQCWSCVKLLNFCFMNFYSAKLTLKWEGNCHVFTPGTITQIPAGKHHRLLGAGLCRVSFSCQGLGCAPGRFQTSG